MPTYAIVLFDYTEDELNLIDKNLRKKLIRDSLIGEVINETEKCQLDKYEILEDTTNKIYRTKFYGFLPCFTRDNSLYEQIYYSSTIPYIYHLLRLEYIKNQSNDGVPLSFLELIYPAKMPTKDYFPFIKFDIGTRIPTLLTKEEKQRLREDIYQEDVEEYIRERENTKIEAQDWNYCILWIDSNRMYMNLLGESYYFKQVGRNVHLFRLINPD